jgi:hypothetical protein
MKKIKSCEFNLRLLLSSRFYSQLFSFFITLNEFSKLECYVQAVKACQIQTLWLIGPIHKVRRKRSLVNLTYCLPCCEMLIMVVAVVKTLAFKVDTQPGSLVGPPALLAPCLVGPLPCWPSALLALCLVGPLPCFGLLVCASY